MVRAKVMMTMLMMIMLMMMMMIMGEETVVVFHSVYS